MRLLTREIWPDANGGSQHWVCVRCCGHLRANVINSDCSSDVGCRGDEKEDRKAE